MGNLALADILSNIHSFIIIATNHCGDDMYKFDASVTPRSGSFYMRAVTSSANFRTANGVGKPVHGNMADLNDFLHGWLNYLVEHHAFPQLSMLPFDDSWVNPDDLFQWDDQKMARAAKEIKSHS